MQFFTVTSAAVLTALATLTSFATVGVASALPAGSTVAFDANAPFPVNSTLKWTGPSKGVNITLYGTSVPDLTAQLKALDPDWKPIDRDLTKIAKRDGESADLEKNQLVSHIFTLLDHFS